QHREAPRLPRKPPFNQLVERQDHPEGAANKCEGKWQCDRETENYKENSLHLPLPHAQTPIERVTMPQPSNAVHPFPQSHSAADPEPPRRPVKGAHTQEPSRPRSAAAQPQTLDRAP